MYKLKVYKDPNVRIITYLLLGLRETAKITNLNSFKFWKNTNRDNLYSYKSHVTIRCQLSKK